VGRLVKTPLRLRPPKVDGEIRDVLVRHKALTENRLDRQNRAVYIVVFGPARRQEGRRGGRNLKFSVVKEVVRSRRTDKGGVRLALHQSHEHS